MFIAKGLLVKGLGGVTAVAGAGAAIYGIHKIISREDNTVINNKITETLKLPESCKFTGDESNNTKECDISGEQLKKIEFKDKGEEDLSLEGTVSNLKLSIKKLQKSDKQQYGDGITVGDPWFTFKTDNINADIKVKKESAEIASLIKGANPEFKINNNKLEKAWTVTTLAEKVNLKCPANGGTEKKCTIEAGATISYKDGDEIKKLTTSSQETEKITYTEDQQNHNQGFKFNVSTAITVSSNTLAAGNYEIKYEAGENKGWYLAKKTNGGA